LDDFTGIEEQQGSVLAANVYDAKLVIAFLAEVGPLHRGDGLINLRNSEAFGFVPLFANLEVVDFKEVLERLALAGLHGF